LADTSQLLPSALGIAGVCGFSVAVLLRAIVALIYAGSLQDEQLVLSQKIASAERRVSREKSSPKRPKRDPKAKKSKGKKRDGDWSDGEDEDEVCAPTRSLF
jgi:hypothetical protein